MPHLDAWIQAQRPDVIGLQETKTEDQNFPDSELAALGYRSVFDGQKTYNGVALLSKESPADVIKGIPNFVDEQKRAIAATYGDVRVINLYVVNGKAVGDEKYEYKMRFLEAVREWVRDELKRYPKLVLMGDFNIAPDDRDVHDPVAWEDQILCSKPERRALQELLSLGLHDSFRLHQQDAGHFSWWDYRAAGFRRNLGLRIDLLLVSEALKASCTDSVIDKEPRMWERPSDHAPVWVELT